MSALSRGAALTLPVILTEGKDPRAKHIEQARIPA